MAREAEIKNVYDALYGSLSIFAYGSATEILTRMSREEPTFAGVEACRAVLEALHLIAV